MGYAVIMFLILLLMSISIALSANHGISKDSQKAPLFAENAYSEREEGKMQTDLVVVSTKINGTARYTSVDQSPPNLMNLHLTIKNNGSINMDPRKYSVIFNRSWVWINSTSNNVTVPLTNSSISSFDLTMTPEFKPMQSLSLLVTAENGVKIITPTSPIITESQLDVSINNSQPEQGCWFDLNISWIPSYGEMWNISKYILYYTTDSSITARVDKNDVNIAFTTSSNTNTFVGRAFRTTKVGQCGSSTGNQTVYLWVSAIDTHGNEGPPSNTCNAQASGGGTVYCSINKEI